MITNKTHTEHWIFELKGQLDTPRRKVDAKLIEKVVRALTLLEQLKLQRLKFIFKGGTSLLLATEVPKRFSIDIDIITEHSPAEIEEALKSIVEAGVFMRGKLADVSKLLML